MKLENFIDFVSKRTKIKAAAPLAIFLCGDIHDIHDKYIK